MNYRKIYDQLIGRAQQRLLDAGLYYEFHHIIPRCMGGDDSKGNIVALLAEEHYIAHLLLVKIYPENESLVFAANMMANRNNKSYSWIKKRFALENSARHKGLKHSDISKKKMSNSSKGRPKSEEHRENIRKKKLKNIEYKGNWYVGYDELQEKTGVSRYLYIKFYLNGQDPTFYIGNNTHGMTTTSRNNHPRSSFQHKWYNNGIQEKYFRHDPGDPWISGRIKGV